MRILFLPGSYTSPSARYRLWQFVGPLRSLGHSVDVRVICPPRPWGSRLKSAQLRRAHTYLGSLSRVISALWMLRDAEKFDVIMMNRDIVPETRVSFLEPWLAERNPRIIFDFDDAIHLGARQRKLRKILPFFSCITPGNDFLAEFACQIHKNVIVLPTVIDTDHYSVVGWRVPGKIRLGWTGSESTARNHLPLLEPILIELARREDFEFIVVSAENPQLKLPGVDWRFIPWSSHTEVHSVQMMDIGLMPLLDKPHERGKCGLKAIQYMGVGIPAVVSPVGANKDIVVDGVTGFHATSEQEWVDKIGMLMNDPGLRKTMGLTGRRHVEAHYSVRSLLPQMINVFEQVQASHS